MHPDTEIDTPMNAVAPMTMKFGAVGGGAESERAQQRAARALQAVADGGEAGNHRFDDDLVLIVTVPGQNDGTVAANMFTHALISRKEAPPHSRDDAVRLPSVWC
jgi:hypothetical protein